MEGKTMKRKITPFILSILMITSSLLLVIGSAAADDWPTFQHDNANTGFSSGVNPEVEILKWRVDDIFPYSRSPAVANGNVYIMGSPVDEDMANIIKVYKYDTDGNHIWTLTLDDLTSAPQYGMVTIAQVQAGTYDLFFAGVTDPTGPTPPTYYVFCYRDQGASATHRWTYQATAECKDAIKVVGDRVYFITSSDKKIHCLNALNGAEIWSHSLGVSVIRTTPAIVDNKVYVSTSSKLFCLDAQDNGDGTTDVLWTYTFPTTTYGLMKSSPTVYQGKVYVVVPGKSYTFNTDLYCLDAVGNGDGTTNVLWSSLVEVGSVAEYSTAVANGKVYVFTYARHIICYHANTGEILWDTPLTLGPTSFNGGYSSPAITSGCFVVNYRSYSMGTSGVLCADLSDEGALLWTHTEDTIYSSQAGSSSPALVNGFIYTTNGKDLLCLGGPNHAPQLPENIDGPERGRVNVTYQFTIPNGIDTENDEISYKYRWGDGAETPWIGPYESGEEEIVPAAHKWTKPGDYDVQIKTKDSRGLESQWSDPLELHIDFLEIRGISGGLGVSATLYNAGHLSKDVTWTIDLIGGTIPGFHINKQHTGEVLAMSPGDMVTISTGPFLALGKFKITLTAECAGELITETVDGKILFFYVIIV